PEGSTTPRQNVECTIAFRRRHEPAEVHVRERANVAQVGMAEQPFVPPEGVWHAAPSVWAAGPPASLECRRHHFIASDSLTLNALPPKRQQLASGPAPRCDLRDLVSQ